MNADEYRHWIGLALRTWDNDRERSQQTRDHRLGVSDVGGCPQYAVLMIRQTPFSDAPSTAKARVGTAMHAMFEQARQSLEPGILVEPLVRIKLDNGIELEGHPDAVDAYENSVTDDKTTNGLGVVTRTGPTLQQRFQVHLYAHGLVQMGVLKAEDLIVRIVWHDRTGADDLPHVWQEWYSPETVRAAESWLNDVVYAVQHGEDADREPSVDWCRACCPFFSTCRLPALPEVEDYIADEPTVNAADVYLEGQDLAKQAKSMVESAKAALEGSSGITSHGVRVRWISVPATDTKRAYRRVDVRKVVTDGGGPVHPATP